MLCLSCQSTLYVLCISRTHGCQSHPFGSGSVAQGVVIFSQGVVKIQLYGVVGSSRNSQTLLNAVVSGSTGGPNARGVVKSWKFRGIMEIRGEPRSVLCHICVRICVIEATRSECGTVAHYSYKNTHSPLKLKHHTELFAYSISAQ